MPMGLNLVGDFMHKPTTVRAAIRVGPGGVETVDLSVPEGQRGDAFAWLERTLPALQTLDRVASTQPPGGSDAR